MLGYLDQFQGVLNLAFLGALVLFTFLLWRTEKARHRIDLTIDRADLTIDPSDPTSEPYFVLTLLNKGLHDGAIRNVKLDFYSENEYVDSLVVPMQEVTRDFGPSGGRGSSGEYADPLLRSGEMDFFRSSIPDSFMEGILSEIDGLDELNVKVYIVPVWDAPAEGQVTVWYIPGDEDIPRTLDDDPSSSLHDEGLPKELRA